MKLLLLILLSTTTINFVQSERSFSIDHERGTFLLDGSPFRYISGSLLYTRIPRPLWHDRLKKIRAAGFNAIQFYIEWSLHERSPGHYDFHGRLDVEAFIEEAASLGLMALVRPGPYICAERNGGGLPFWLYQLYPNIKVRTSDSQYLHHVDLWWDQLLPRLEKHLYINGGNIIMLQIENEYGSFGLQTHNCDVVYMAHLRDQARKHLGHQVLLYTTDGDSVEMVRCGSVAGVYPTIDFGPGTNVTEAFRVQRLFTEFGPLINSEFYPGWLDYWAQPHSTVSTKSVIKTLTEMLHMGANVNVYMMHGGTNFAFEAGANTGTDPKLTPEPTSYDYDAPISEAGDLTPKYFAIKEVVSKYLPIPNISVEAHSPKEELGPIRMHPVSSFFNAKDILLKYHSESIKPKTFEELGQDSGFVLYETSIDQRVTDPAALSIEGLHDRGYVYLNHKFQGILGRGEDIKNMPLRTTQGDILHILVENQGRIGYGPDIKDFKGITGSVTLGSGSYKHTLKNWKMYQMPLDNVDLVMKYANAVLDQKEINESYREELHNNMKLSRHSGSFWHGKFNVPCHDSRARDTFLSLPGWSKGVAFLNGVNLGRYWPSAGPQMTLYIPGVYLHCGHFKVNKLVLFEQESAGHFVELVKSPELAGPTPDKREQNVLNKKSFTRFNY